jgi:nucleoside 2-deoxyribosyltransferase
MKIYFAFTVRGDRSKLSQGKEIVRLLQNRGHEVLTTHVFEENAAELDSRLKPEEVFSRDMRWLNEADAILIEASGASFGVGFEAGFALGAMNKKVFLVYDSRLKDKISRMATGLMHRNCIKFEYSSLDELKNFIEEHF